MAEGRWSDAIATLEVLSADDAFDAERRSILDRAGDILVQHYGDSVTARRCSIGRARSGREIRRCGTCGILSKSDPESGAR